jgi:hypothetical protein
MATPSAFPLRLRSPRLRELVREIAEREHLSQNEFIEQAVEHEVVARGALLAEELAAAASRLAQLTDEQHAVMLSRSVDAFVAGEARREPLQATALHTKGHGPFTAVSVPARDDALGVLAAFESGRG